MDSVDLYPLSPLDFGLELSEQFYEDANGGFSSGQTDLEELLTDLESIGLPTEMVLPGTDVSDLFSLEATELSNWQDTIADKLESGSVELVCGPSTMDDLNSGLLKMDSQVRDWHRIAARNETEATRVSQSHAKDSVLSEEEDLSLFDIIETIKTEDPDVSELTEEVFKEEVFKRINLLASHDHCYSAVVATVKMEPFDEQDLVAASTCVTVKVARAVRNVTKRKVVPKVEKTEVDEDEPLAKKLRDNKLRPNPEDFPLKKNGKIMSPQDISRLKHSQAVQANKKRLLELEGIYKNKVSQPELEVGYKMRGLIFDAFFETVCKQHAVKKNMDPEAYWQAKKVDHRGCRRAKAGTEKVKLLRKQEQDTEASDKSRRKAEAKEKLVIGKILFLGELLKREVGESVTTKEARKRVQSMDLLNKIMVATGISESIPSDC